MNNRTSHRTIHVLIRDLIRDLWKAPIQVISKMCTWGPERGGEGGRERELGCLGSHGNQRILALLPRGSLSHYEAKHMQG